MHRHHEIPTEENLATIPIPRVGTVNLPVLLRESGVEKTAGSARRLIEGGAVFLGEERIDTFDFPADSLRGRVLRIGRRRFFRLA